MCKRCVFIPTQLKIKMLKEMNSKGGSLEEYINTMDVEAEQKFNLFEQVIKLCTLENQDERRKSVDKILNNSTGKWEEYVWYVSQKEDFYLAKQRLGHT